MASKKSKRNKTRAQQQPAPPPLSPKADEEEDDDIKLPKLMEQLAIDKKEIEFEPADDEEGEEDQYHAVDDMDDSPKAQAEGPQPSTRKRDRWLKLKVDWKLAPALESGAAIERPAKGRYCESPKEITVQANHFPLTINIDKVFQYAVELHRSTKHEDLEYTEKKLKSSNWRVNREVMEDIRKKCPIFKDIYFVYDGDRKIISNKKLPFSKETEFEFEFKNQEDQTSQFYLVYICEADMGNGYVIDLRPIKQFYKNEINQIPEDAISAVETILRHHPFLKYCPVRRSFYQRNERPRVIKGGLELWEGHYQSVTIGENGLYLNIDKKLTPFYPPIPLMHFIPLILGYDKATYNYNINKNDFDRICQQLRGVRVEFQIKGRKVYSIINNVVISDSHNIKIDSEKGKVTLYDHYKREYGITLKYPKFPCVETGTKDKFYHAMEFLSIKNEQAFIKKLDSEQSSQMIRFTAIEPTNRFTFIKNRIQELNVLWVPIKTHFKIDIVPQMLTLRAKKLDPPTLVSQNNVNVAVDQGKWSLNKKQLETVKHLEKWTIINMTRMDQTKVLNFAQRLSQYSRNLGVNIAPPARYDHCANTAHDLKENLDVVFKRYPQKPQIILYIINDIVDQPFIKTYCKDVYQVPTQCIKDNIVNKVLNTDALDVLLNLSLGINSKVGGTNLILLNSIRPQILNQPIIIMGADVNHPSPGSDKPSIASVVGSLDRKISKYIVLHSKQEARMEIIKNLQEFTTNIINAFHAANRCYPSRIVFLRDGVGRGQYKDVKVRELALMKLACEKLNINPTITLVVVTKRHNTRFNVEDSRDGVGRQKNIPPGTTVDRMLCHRFNYEYIQCDHTGIQGTTKPTKYTVLCDENNLNATELQKLTYYLCHTYAYCTRSISIPAPIQYAHNDAYKGKDFTLADIGRVSDTQSRDQYNIH